MTRDKALREAQRRWGKKALIRAYDRISSPEERAEAREYFDAAKARIEAIDREIADRLAALDWYQALKAERAAMVKDKQTHIGRMSYYKFTVGRDSMGIAFAVEGQGDTWEMAFAQADARKTAGS